MKVIKVSDEVFERLKEQADLGYRAIGKHIEYLLNNQADKAKTTLTSAEVEQGENKMMRVGSRLTPLVRQRSYLVV